MSVLMNYAIFPTDKGASVSKYVSRVISMVSESGYDYKLTAMGTIIEFETVEQATEIINRSYNLLKDDCLRVYSSITLDIQQNKPIGRMRTKIESVEDTLGKTVNK